MFVSFDNETNETLGFWLTHKDNSPPAYKKASVSIPGADGELDLTEYFGAVRFNNRAIRLNCVSANREYSHFVEIVKKLHGKKKKIRFADEPGFYYVGRMALANFSNAKSVGEFVINIDAEPYRYKEAVTVVTTANNKTVTLNNLYKPVVPEIKLTGPTTITYGDYIVSLSAGTYLLADIELKEGANEITLSGTGNVTFTYQEGAL